MQILKILGAFFLIIISIFVILYVYPLLKRLGLSDGAAIGIIVAG